MLEDPQPIPTLLILCRDLLLGSKITSAAQSAGVTYRLVRDAEKLLGLAGNRLIVDLNQDGALDAAVEWKREGGLEVVGFVSHVDSDTIDRARSAGFDQVLSRSQLVTQFSSLLNTPHK